MISYTGQTHRILAKGNINSVHKFWDWEALTKHKTDDGHFLVSIYLKVTPVNVNVVEAIYMKKYGSKLLNNYQPYIQFLIIRFNERYMMWYLCKFYHCCLFVVYIVLCIIFACFVIFHFILLLVVTLNARMTSFCILNAFVRINNENTHL